MGGSSGHSDLIGLGVRHVSTTKQVAFSETLRPGYDVKLQSTKKLGRSMSGFIIGNLYEVTYDSKIINQFASPIPGLCLTHDLKLRMPQTYLYADFLNLQKNLCTLGEGIDLLGVKTKGRKI